jgi:transcriptional regulator with GAF, ATPase, and Fis domain
MGGTGEVEEVHCLGVDLSASGSDGPTGSLAAELASLREKMAGLERDKVALRRQLEKRAGASAGAVAPVSPQGAHEPIPGLGEGEQDPTLAELERRYILHVLDETKGRISGPKGAATILGLHANTLRSRMAKHGIVKGM